MSCCVIASTIRLFKALFIVLLGAAMTFNNMAMASMRHMQAQPQLATTHAATMHCHDAAQQASPVPDDLPPSGTAGHSDKHACADMLCCSLALSPLRPLLRIQISRDSPAPQFWYTAQVLAGYFARPDPPPRPVI